MSTDSIIALIESKFATGDRTKNHCLATGHVPVEVAEYYKVDTVETATNVKPEFATKEKAREAKGATSKQTANLQRILQLPKHKHLVHELELYFAEAWIEDYDPVQSM